MRTLLVFLSVKGKNMRTKGRGGSIIDNILRTSDNGIFIWDILNHSFLTLAISNCSTVSTFTYKIFAFLLNLCFYLNSEWWYLQTIIDHRIPFTPFINVCFMILVGKMTSANVIPPKKPLLSLGHRNFPRNIQRYINQ